MPFNAAELAHRLSREADAHSRDGDQLLQTIVITVSRRW
jgi:hypothetical protein